MALGERFRSGGTRGIARFLADHQHCDAGFDVRREGEPGSGKLRITCLGCGQTIAYKAAEAREFAAARVDLNGPKGGAPAPVEPIAPIARPAPAGPPPAAGPPVPGRRPQPREVTPPWRGLPGWIPVLLSGALIVGGLAMIAIGLTRSDDGGTGSNAATQPAEIESAGDQAGPGGSPELDKRTFLGRFEIGVPTGWRSDRGDDGVTLQAPEGVAAVRIVSQPGEFPDSELARGAAAFLAEEHPGARVGEPDRVRVGGRRATRVRATYPAGVETAFAVSARGSSYLINERVDRGAPAEVSEQADAAVESFRPR